MKVSKKQLRNIVREAVRRKLEMGPADEGQLTYDPVQIDGPYVTMEQLQQLIDEEMEEALQERETLNEDLFDYTGKNTEKKVGGGGAQKWQKVGANVNMLKKSIENLENAMRDDDEHAVAKMLERVKQFTKAAEQSLYGMN